MIHLRLALEYFVPWTNDAGYQVAIARGWYRDAGLDVRQVLIDPLFGDTLASLAAGEAEIGVFPTNRLFVRREAGEKLLGVAAVNHRGMETIQSLVGAGISRPRDLAGRRIALNPTPRGLAMVRHLVAADGGDPDSLIIVDSGSLEINADHLDDGFADAFFGAYWAWDALIGSVPEEQRVIWPVDEIGAPPYHSYLLGLREELAEREPQAVRDFLAVTERGFRAAREEPEAALEVLLTTIPYVPEALLRRSLGLISPTWFHEDRWGIQREELHQPYAQWLADNGILNDVAIWTEATTDEFLPTESGAEK
jgi:NitT/TauT family transport system substrate-binding protein